MNEKTRLVVVCLLVMALSGCAVFNAPATEVPSGGVLFQDDFSDPKSGWDIWKDTTGSLVAYTAGGLRFLVQEQQFDYWSRPGKRFADVSLEVDAIKLDGPDDNDFGFICRYQNRDNFYALLISSDGYAGILKVKDGVYTMIHANQMEYSTAINQGGASNHLRGFCLGPTLALFVNGKKAVHAVDLDFSAGEVGLMAGTNSKPGVDILFDNFLVTRP